MNSKHHITVAILIILLNHGVQSSFPSRLPNPTAEFYEDVDFKGLIWQGPVTQFKLRDDCITLPKWGNAKASSLKTTSCIIAYAHASCRTGEDFSSYSFAAGNYSNLLEVKHHSQNADNAIKSFRACTEDECKYGVHVSLYKGKGKEDRLVEYFNLNKCTNLPSYSNQNVDALDNHGNCVAFYDAMDCKGRSVTIRGGVSQESLNLKYVNFAGNTVSIGPCPNVTAISCSGYNPFY